MLFNKNPVLQKYIATACVFIFLLSASFIVNNFFLLRSLESSFRERTLYLIENAYQSMEERWHLYAISAITINLDRVGGIRNLAQHRNPTNIHFYTGARTLTASLRALQFSHPEIVDVIIWYDNLDVFFNTEGSWNKDMLPHWLETGNFESIDFSLLHGEENSSIFTMNNHVVYYNNYHRDTHIFMVLYPSALELSLAQLIPEGYGTFVIINADGTPLPISNGGQHISEEPDIVMYGRWLPLIYHFYYNPVAYSGVITTMTFMSIGIISGIVIFTVFVLHRIKKDLYDPVSRIMNLLKINKDANNEFSQIMDAIELMHTDISHLSFNKALSADDTEKIKTLIDYNFPHYCALTILFEDEEGYKDSDKLRLFASDFSHFNCHPVHVVGKHSIYYFFFETVKAYDDFIAFLSAYLSESIGFNQCGLSTIYNDLSNINTALEESFMAFNEGARIEYSGVINKSKISTINHNRLIAEALKGDIEKIKITMMEILNENENVSASAKRRLMLYMYDTICMLTEQMSNEQGQDRPKDTHLYDIYNLSLLFDLLCADLTARLNIKVKVDDVLEWVSKNMHRDISLSDLADTMGMSYSYASAFFKNKVGMNFLEYLQKKRIEQSMLLLASTDKGIDEIAISTGFVSVNTFFRVFKKYAGVTPGAYRDTAMSKT